MADLYRLIVAVLLLCFGPPALADGGPFPATPGQWNTAYCNSTNFPVGQLGAGISASWTCKATANPNVQDCGYTYNNGYYDGKCTQQKGPDSCPSGSTMSTSGSGASVCTCGAGLVPFNGGCQQKPQCPEGTHEEGGACVPNDCKPDETRVNGVCVKDPPCPAGETRINGVCKKNKCKAGASAGDYTDLSDSVTYLCEMSDGMNCQVRIKPTICVKIDGIESCTGAGTFTGATCSGGNGGTGGGNGSGDAGGNNGGNGSGPGTGGGGNGSNGTGSGGTGTGGGGTGTGTGGGGTGTGGGGTGSGGTGSGGTGSGGTGDGGTGNGGTGTGTGNGGSGPGSGSGGPNLPPPIVIPPAPEGVCPDGYHKSGNWCVKNPVPPDGNGGCPQGSVKINGNCVYTEPPSGGGGGTGTGGGGTGTGSGNGEGEEGNGFGGSCISGFACEGDAIQCAIAKEQYARNCKLFDDTSAESDLYNANKGKTGNQTGDLPGNETISLSGRIDTSDPLGGGGCIGDLSITVWGHGVSLPLSNLCQYLAMLGNILVAVSMLMAARIVTRG
ncbi:hypothetical protein ATF69_2144 [Acidovorax delafieldii]|uniref:TspB protein n=1 Tax=Acidovorax delafieldii TaxID=47920 RepID=A0A561XQ16_ACIDE|nr:virulence factor TspB C-terminal domain-related protein [Acidovorax delafieldii]TWG38202.1 hypothetical protein ATF69_2144 [Acidovorax delafieldii]